LKKLVFLLITILILVFSLTACGPSGDPEEYLMGYYEDVVKKDVESAYNRLSIESQKNFSKDDFVLWHNLHTEVNKLVKADVELLEKEKNFEIDGVIYNEVATFSVIETVEEFYDSKEQVYTSERYVVSEDGEWKIYRGKEDGSLKVSELYNALSWMYLEGNGKSKDINQGLMVIKEGLNYNSDFIPLHYGLCYSYYTLGRYDESIEACERLIELSYDDETQQSNTYNILGLSYQEKGDIESAKDCFERALDLDPNNEYARTNLNWYEN
jgi:tetratricopeptide (TPR) repeat protein